MQPIVFERRVGRSVASRNSSNAASRSLVTADARFAVRYGCGYLGVPQLRRADRVDLALPRLVQAVVETTAHACRVECVACMNLYAPTSILTHGSANPCRNSAGIVTRRLSCVVTQSQIDYAPRSRVGLSQQRSAEWPVPEISTSASRTRVSFRRRISVRHESGNLPRLNMAATPQDHSRCDSGSLADRHLALRARMYRPQSSATCGGGRSREVSVTD